MLYESKIKHKVLTLMKMYEPTKGAVTANEPGVNITERMPEMPLIAIRKDGKATAGVSFISKTTAEHEL